jgi:hypothetical protein
MVGSEGSSVNVRNASGNIHSYTIKLVINILLLGSSFDFKSDICRRRQQIAVTLWTTKVEALCYLRFA